MLIPSPMIMSSTREKWMGSRYRIMCGVLMGCSLKRIFEWMEGEGQNKSDFMR